MLRFQQVISRLKAVPVPPAVRFFLGYATVIYGIVFLYRTAFLAVYGYRLGGATGFEVFRAEVYGLRFDFSTIVMLLGVFLVLGLIQPLNRFTAFRGLWRYGPLPVVFVSAALLVADIMYYENGNKHIGYEAYAYLNRELFTIIGAGIVSNPVAVLGGIGALGLLMAGGVRVVRRFKYAPVPQSWLVQGAWLVIGLAFVMIGIRGGVQQSPLRVTDAVKFENDFLNVLIVNGVYTVVADAKTETLSKHHRMEPDAAARVVREIIDYPGAKFLSDEYPMLREVAESNPGRPPNVVIIVLEGWTGKFVRPITDGMVDGKEVTPYFNQLAKEGLFFSRMFASGGRTTNGLLALIGGIPDRPGLTAVRTPQIMNRFSGLPSLLAGMGYNTFFISGNDLNFNNKGTIMSHWGSSELTGKKQIDLLKRFEIGAWGYYDRDVFTLLHEKLMELHKTGKPMNGIVHTITTHYPYKTPDMKFEVFGKETRDHEYINVLHYADWALHDYLETAKKAPYFKDTVFFFISDHSHHRFLNYYEDRNVPFLVYAPGRIAAEHRREIVSSLDFLPTVVGVTGKRAIFASMGRDLRRAKGAGAYYAYGNLFGWIEDDVFYLQTVESRDAGTTHLAGPPYTHSALCEKDVTLCDKPRQRAKAYLNLSYMLLDQNRIYPPASFFKDPAGK